MIRRFSCRRSGSGSKRQRVDEKGRDYPWEGPWDPTRCNSVENGLNCTTAVGVIRGARPCKACWIWLETCWNGALTSMKDRVSKPIDHPLPLHVRSAVGLGARGRAACGHRSGLGTTRVSAPLDFVLPKRTVLH